MEIHTSIYCYLLLKKLVVDETGLLNKQVRFLQKEFPPFAPPSPSSLCLHH